MTSRDAEQGYAMAALLVGLSVMAVLLGAALPVWQTVAQREREAELIFRGEQYARAVALYQRARGAFPPSIDVLVNERFLRKRYADPMTEDGQFQPIFVGQALPGQGGAAPSPQGAGRAGGTPPGQTAGGAPPAARGITLGQGPAGAPVLGVVSRSAQTSLRQYNGRGRYNEWAFVAVEATQQGGAGTSAPAGRGGPVPERGRGAGLPPGGGIGRGGQRGAGPGTTPPGRGRFGAPGRGVTP